MRIRRAVAAIILVGVFLVAFGPGSQVKKLNVRTFDFTYITEVKDIPAHAREVSVWIPYPPNDANQQITDMRIASPYPTKLTRDPEYGNQILFVSIREPKEASVKIEMSFRVQRRENIHKPFENGKNASSGDPEPLLKRWRQPDKLVPIDGAIRQLALEVTKGKTTDLEKSRAIYEYAVANLKYDKSGTGWGRGDIYYACDIKRGNCTDFHAVFTGFARAVGVPARFEIGFPLPIDRGEGHVAGYHCWSQFYVEGQGWIPVDASEGNKNPARRDYFFGAHDENRVLFTIGRDIRLSPSQKGEPLNFFIYPYVEVDGTQFSSVQKRFFFKDADAPTPQGASHAASSVSKPR